MATREPPGDPRALPLGTEEDIRPVVTMPRQGMPAWAIVVGAVIAGLILFAFLDARRRAATSPDLRIEASEASRAFAPPPALIVPAQVSPQQVRNIAPAAVAPARPIPPPAPPQIIYVPQPVPMAAEPTAMPEPPPRAASGPALIVDAGTAPSATGGEAASAPAGDGAAPAAGGRARAGMFANRSTTVVQGTLVQAVLETALDSTRPGFARAIVSRDVRGFDGSRVLIPRGSRLIGEYRSETARGQRRAMVNWARLIRPDGVTMAIGSPAGDPLGRGGIRANVNSHFLERFAGAILQSVLDIGVSLAGRAGNNTVVVLPGGGAQAVAPQVVQPGQVTPTLTVRQGTSISIFVARDLDFSGAGTRR